MLTIHTDTLTARQLHCLGPLLPRHGVDTHHHTIAVNLAECPHREALIAWLNATAPVYWGSIKIRGVKRRNRPPSESRTGVRGRRLDVQPSMSAIIDPTDFDTPLLERLVPANRKAGDETASGSVRK